MPGSRSAAPKPIKNKGVQEAPSRRTRSTGKVDNDEVMDEEDELDNDANKPLGGKKVVVSGEFESISRKKLEELIE